MLRLLFLLCISAAVAVPTRSHAASTSANLAITVTKSQAITAVSLSNSSFTGGAPSGTVVGAIGVTMSPATPAFSGTLTLSGSSASNFQIAGTNLETNGVVPAGTYQINIVAAQAGASGSPFTAPETITGAASPATPPSPPDPPIGSILPPDRDASANWRMAGMLSAGGIPNRTAVCATVSPLGSGQDDTADINNAITACAAGQVVQLTAGTFTINEGNYVFLNKGITLRGMGPCTLLNTPNPTCTLLQRTNGATLGSYVPGAAATPIILVGAGRYGITATPTPLSADAAQGSYSVQVSNASGFAVGQIVYLDEAADQSWQPDPAGMNQVWAEPDAPAGEVQGFRMANQYHNPSVAGDTGDSCYFQQTCDHVTNEFHKIASISGTTITFDSPVTISYRVSHSAALSYYSVPYVTNSGVENLSAAYGDDSDLAFQYCAGCWAKNVEAYYYLNDGIRINYSFRVQLEGVYVHHAVWPINGGAGYNISLNLGSSEILIENSISVLANKVITIKASGAGSVVAYNYFDDGGILRTDDADNGWQEIGTNASHMTGSHHVLFEGNWTFNMDSDSDWGASIYTTMFRNYSSGFRSPFTNYLSGTPINDLTNANFGPERTAGAQIYSDWHSFIGNVLGTPGHMNGWVYDSNGNKSQPSIYLLGWIDWATNVDPNVAATAIRDGNFDYVTNSVIWAASDTAHTLPNSLYLSGEPGFFSTGSGYTWPWVNPTGSPQLYTLPAKARYDAGTPFTQP